LHCIHLNSFQLYFDDCVKVSAIRCNKISLFLLGNSIKFCKNVNSFDFNFHRKIRLWVFEGQNNFSFLLALVLPSR
jgi:hypothetical protein